MKYKLYGGRNISVATSGFLAYDAVINSNAVLGFIVS